MLTCRSGVTSGEVCPICLGKRFKVYVDDQEHDITCLVLGPSRTEVSPGRILMCMECRFGFRRTRPSDNQLGQRYEQLDSELYESESHGKSLSALRQLKIIERYAKPPGRIFDIGCGSGVFLGTAVNAGWKGEGVEPSKPLVRKARQFLDSDTPVHWSTLQAAPIGGRDFDVVTLWDVLEHVTDPIGFLSQARSLLKPGGILFANVPDLDSFQARLLGSKWPLLLPEHLNYFTCRSLKMCGAAAGLHWIDSCRRSAAFSLGYIFRRLRQHGVPGSILACRLIDKVRIKNLTIRVSLGEICGVWKR